MDFNEALYSCFGEDVLKAYEDCNYGPDAEREAKVEVSFDQLVKLWNAGVENGCNGMHSAMYAARC